MKEKEIIDLFEQKLNLKVLSVKDKSKGVDQEVKIVKTSTGNFVLKIPEDKKKIANEILGCEMVSETGISVPKVIFHNENLLVETAIEGTDLGDVEITPEIYLELGKLLKKIHSVKINGFGEIKDGKGIFESQVQNVESFFFDDLKKFGKEYPDKIESVKKYYEAKKEIMKNSEPVLLHGDIADNNIMISDQYISGIIDFGDLSAGPAMQDFAFMYIGHYGKKQFEYLLEGYGEHNLEEIEFYAFVWMTWLLSGELNEARKIRMEQLYDNILSNK